MGPTFDRRLQKVDARLRIGSGGRTVPDLRLKITTKPVNGDARSLLTRKGRGRGNRFSGDLRSLVGNRGQPSRIGRQMRGQNSVVPFKLPLMTVKNDLYNSIRSTSRQSLNPLRRTLNNTGRSSFQTSNFRNRRGALTRTIRSAPSQPDFAIPPVAGSSMAPGLFANLAMPNLFPIMPAAAGSSLSPIQGFRIEVKNLMASVTLDDVYDLFSSVGSIKSCRLVKQGVGEVIFNKFTDAQTAVSRYNGRELDGRPMRLQLLTRVDSNSVDTEARAPAVSVYNASATRRSAQRPLTSSEVSLAVLQRALYNVTAPGVGPQRPVDFNVNLR